MISGAGRGISRTKLGHAGSHRQREDRGQRPAQRHLQRAAHFQAVAEQRHRAGENRNDGKGNGEVRKPAHAAEQFLGVAEAAQVGAILIRETPSRGAAIVLRPALSAC